MEKVYAKIKKSSKYYSQNAIAKKNGEFPFPVRVDSNHGEYMVQGGPGGQYRLSDVNLYMNGERIL